jgi:hypothetical protein
VKKKSPSKKSAKKAAKKAVRKAAPKTSQNESKFQWDEQRCKAAQQVAEGQSTEHQIAEGLGVGRATIERWKAHVEFQARVKEIVDETAAALKKQGIRIKETRLAKLDRMVRRIESVIAGRAEDMPEAPGGKSGLLARDYKGKDADRTVYKFDAPMVKEYRECLKQAAIELGEWTEKREHTIEDVTPIKTIEAVKPNGTA